MLGVAIAPSTDYTNHQQPQRKAETVSLAQHMLNELIGTLTDYGRPSVTETGAKVEVSGAFASHAYSPGINEPAVDGIGIGSFQWYTSDDIDDETRAELSAVVISILAAHGVEPF